MNIQDVKSLLQLLQTSQKVLKRLNIFVYLITFICGITLNIVGGLICLVLVGLNTSIINLLFECEYWFNEIIEDLKKLNNSMENFIKEIQENKGQQLKKDL